MRKLISYLAAVLASLTLWGQNVTLENALIDAVTLYESGDLDGAMTRFQKIHAADSTNDAACYYLGMCESVKGRYDSAAALLRDAVRLDPANSWYRNALASILMTQGRNAEAVPLLEDLVVEYPQLYNNPYMLTMVGDSYLNQYKDSVALGWYDRALELDPMYAPAEIGKAEIFRYRANNPAFFVSVEKVVRNPEVIATAKSEYLQGLMDRMDAKFWWVWGDQICALVDTCVVMHPEDMGSRWLKVNTCAIKDDWDGVLDQCRDMAKIAADAGDTENLAKAYSTMGDVIHEQKGDDKETFRMYDLALKADPEYVPVLNNYAYYLSVKGKKLKKALKMSAVTIEKEPDNATYLDTYAWILHLLGRDSEAKPYFKHAIIYGGRDSQVILEHYSEVLRALGDNDLADYYKRLSGKE